MNADDLPKPLTCSSPRGAFPVRESIINLAAEHGWANFWRGLEFDNGIERIEAAWTPTGLVSEAAYVRGGRWSGRDAQIRPRDSGKRQKLIRWLTGDTTPIGDLDS